MPDNLTSDMMATNANDETVAQSPHARLESSKTNDIETEQKSSNESHVTFLELCAEPDESGHCKSSKLSFPKRFKRASMRIMPRRWSSTGPSDHVELLSISTVKHTGSTISLLLPLIFLLTVLLIPEYCLPLILDEMVPPGSLLLPLALSCLVVLPALLFLKWVSHIMKKSFDFGSSMIDDDQRPNRPGIIQQLIPSVPLICISLAIIFRETKNLVKFWLDDETAYSEFYMLLLDYAASMSIFTASISGLDALHGAVTIYAQKADMISKNKHSEWWKSNLKSFKSTVDPEKNKAYAVPGGYRSPAKVLADIIGIYCNIGKILSVTLLLLFFLDINLDSNLVVLSLTVLFAGVVTSLHLQDATMNVISLTVSNTFHLGDMISVGRPGFNPADDPSEHLTGFLEGVTWGHVIIRDFGRKQVFIRHDEFGKLTIHNWTRRPNKGAHFIIPVVPELSGGSDRVLKLTRFAAKWMKSHPSVDQSLYQKARIKFTRTKGLILEAIFYPVNDASAHQLRGEFAVMIVDAAKRLNICLLPAEIRNSSAWHDDSNNHWENVDLSDLNPSPEFTERVSFKPKSA